MVGYIYIHTSPSGKSYIGQTYNMKGTKARWRNGHGYDNGTIIRAAIDKYGWDNFSHDILHEVEEDDLETLVDSLDKLEEYEIINRKTIVPDGYNSVSGGYNSIVSGVTSVKSFDPPGSVTVSKQIRDKHSLEEYNELLIHDYNIAYEFNVKRNNGLTLSSNSAIVVGSIALLVMLFIGLNGK